MKDFINDEEEEDDQSDSYDHRRRRNKKKLKQKPKYFNRVDDDDREMIQENTGIEISKRKRLNRLAERERVSNDDKALVKKEIEVKEKREPVTKIESNQHSKYHTKIMHRDYYDERRIVENERMMLMQNVFYADGDDDLLLPGSGGVMQTDNPDDAQLDEVFNADEVDDPFSSKEDKLIE